ncbi:putative Diacylglycerol O-acyltransferase 1C [Nannochloris sp. 'desiccata']|nr:putative Diacylglycerol O-acyltransferase 1C [Chlorella desiccata (nom. nud.)]
MLRTRQHAAEAADAEIEELQKENERLKGLLADRAAQGSNKSGYLEKFRPHSTASLWANIWEPRYVILRGQKLTYYRSERDVYFPPRGEINLAKTIVLEQGLRRRKYYTFKVVDRAGVDLIRLSTHAKDEYTSWLEALERAGCVRRIEEDPRNISPTPSQNISPTHSGISDTTADTANSERLRSGSGGGERWRLGEVDSGGLGSAGVGGNASGTNLADKLRHQPSGYTSDASDIGPRPPRPQKGPREACAPVHMNPRFSLLSSERITLTNQSGVWTLVIIVLAATNARLILENLMKYGLRFNPFTFLKAAVTPSGNFALLMCWPALLLFSFVALGIERFAARCLDADIKEVEAERKKNDKSQSSRRWLRLLNARGRIVENFVLLLNIINTSLELIGPCWVITVTNADPLPAFSLTMVTAILWLKLVSFAHVNWSLRRCRRRQRDPSAPLPGESGSGMEPQGIEDDKVKYPVSLMSVKKFIYFLLAPTLCYQLSYPRSPRIRLRWMLRRVSMFFAALGLMLFFFEQYIEPTIDNSLKPLQEMDWLRMAERVLKLSIPTLYFWLAMFYALFDLWLNILAEATRFGDREFYKEWWNATTLGEYWRLWNMPVHKWMVRHVYFPCIHAGLPKFAAGVIVFFVSAVFHELLVGVPLHMLRGWAFWGIMAQVPLMWMTEMLKNKYQNNDRLGNVIFWVSFCFLGQPLAEILYFHDYRKKTHIGL